MLALSRSELDQHGVAVALLLEPDLPPVQADRVQVQQVIGNLILNAVDAMEGVAVAERRLSLLSRRDGQRITLSVRDRGIIRRRNSRSACSRRSGPRSRAASAWA